MFVSFPPGCIPRKRGVLFGHLVRRWGNIVGRDGSLLVFFVPLDSPTSMDVSVWSILQEYVYIPDGDLYSKVSKRSFYGPSQSQQLETTRLRCRM